MVKISSRSLQSSKIKKRSLTPSDAVIRLRTKLYPSKKKATPWYDHIHEWVVKLAKYVGIPGLIIASFAPMQKLYEDVSEHFNKKHIQDTYFSYATTLLDEHAIDRANKLLATFETQKDYNPELQYYKAKILIAMAIQQGKNYTEALDTANILTRIQEESMWLFPHFGGVDEILELRMAIIDIDIAQQRYDAAKSGLTKMGKDSKLTKHKFFQMNSLYREGVIDVLQFRLPEAISKLSEVVYRSANSNQKLLLANATFQLAKAQQFSYNHDKAIETYAEAEAAYKEIDDQFGLLRTYNNIAMIYSDKEDDETARKYYNMQQNLARKLGDELGYARATANLGLLEKKQKNYDAAIRLALEALGVFKQQSNLLGITTTAITLSNSYFALENYPEAIAYANQALVAGLQLRELRAVGSACGSLANVYGHTKDYGESIFSSLCAASIIKYLGNSHIPGPARDYQVFMRYIDEAKSSLRPVQFEEYLGKAASRLGGMVIQLNLDKIIMKSEIEKLQ